MNTNKYILKQIDEQVEQPIREVAAAIRRLSRKKSLNSEQVKKFDNADASLRFWLNVDLAELKQLLAPGTVGGSNESARGLKK